MDFKYRFLYSSNLKKTPGPKGPSPELIQAICEVKRRNPVLSENSRLPWILENPAVSSTDLAPSRGRNPGQIAPKIRSSASEPSSVFPHLLSRLAQPQPAERHRISPGESSSPNGTTG